jgi:hypothetical protein
LATVSITGGFPELSAQPADRRLDRLAERIGVLVPHAREKPLSGDHCSLSDKHLLKNGKLLGVKRERPSCSDGKPAGGVERQVAMSESRRSPDPGPAASARIRATNSDASNGFGR